MAHFLIFVPGAAALSLSLSWEALVGQLNFSTHSTAAREMGKERGVAGPGGDEYKRDGECQPATDTATDSGE